MAACIGLSVKQSCDCVCSPVLPGGERYRSSQKYPLKQKSHPSFLSVVKTLAAFSNRGKRYIVRKRNVRETDSWAAAAAATHCCSSLKEMVVQDEIYLSAETTLRGGCNLWRVHRRSPWYFLNKDNRGRAFSGSHPVPKLKWALNTPDLRAENSSQDQMQWGSVVVFLMVDTFFKGSVLDFLDH